MSSYQPYPTSAQQSEAVQSREAPKSVQIAVRCMYAGAALSLISLIVGLATISSIKSAIEKKYPGWSSTKVHSAEVADIVILIVAGIIGIALWIWMARANQSGHSYARIMGTVLFGIDTLFILGSLARPSAGIGVVFSILTWLAGLGAVVFLWRKDSGPYFAKTPVA